MPATANNYKCEPRGVYVIIHQVGVLTELQRGLQSWLVNSDSFSSISSRIENTRGVAGAVIGFPSKLHLYKNLGDIYPRFSTWATIGNFLDVLKQLFILLVMLLVKKQHLHRKYTRAQCFGSIVLTHLTEASWYSDWKQSSLSGS